MRRSMTAAVIFVLIGSLAAIVVNIMAPPENSQKTIARKTVPSPAINNDDPVAAKPSEFAVAADSGDSVFSAALTMTTKESLAMDNFVWKAIYNNGLKAIIFWLLSHLYLTCFDTLTACPFHQIQYRSSNPRPALPWIPSQPTPQGTDLKG